MKKCAFFGMVGSLIGLMLIVSSCQYFKRTQIEPIYQKEEEYSPEEFQDFEPEPLVLCFEEFKKQLIMLFEKHGLLLNEVMIDILNDLSAEIVEEGKNNLFNNAHEIALSFQTVYGSNVVYRIEDLLNQQIALQLAYFNAINFQDRECSQQFLVQTYSNGHLFMQFLNIMNPFFPYNYEKYMIDEHITLESNQALEYFKGNIEQAEDLKHRSIKQLQELATHIANSIEEQMTDNL